MINKNTPVVIFGIIWLLASLVSWLFVPAWREYEGGIFLLFSSTAVGVIAVLQGGFSIFTNWITSLKQIDPSFVSGNGDSTARPFRHSDTDAIDEYIKLSSMYDDRFTKLKKKHNLQQHCVSMGLLKMIEGIII